MQISREKIRREVLAEIESLGAEVSPEKISEIVELRLRKEVNRGVQTIQYQVVTLLTTNGQAPFVTVYMYLNEAKNEQEKADLAMIIEETLKQRYQGVKNEAGVSVPPSAWCRTISPRRSCSNSRATFTPAWAAAAS